MHLITNLGKSFTEHSNDLARVVEVIVGIILGIDAYLKIAPGFTNSFSQSIVSLPADQPSFLQGWFSFWSSFLGSHPSFFVHLAFLFESLFFICLVLGLLRKPVYVLGFFMFLFIWSVPEAFGGPYVSGTTDIGPGILYSIVFVLLALCSTNGLSRFTLDVVISKRIKWWPK